MCDRTLSDTTGNKTLTQEGQTAKTACVSARVRLEIWIVIGWLSVELAYTPRQAPGNA
jgi:hypothetical protein